MKNFIALLRHELILQNRYWLLIVSFLYALIFAGAIKFIFNQAPDHFVASALCGEIVTMALFFTSFMCFMDYSHGVLRPIFVTPVSLYQIIAPRIISVSAIVLFFAALTCIAASMSAIYWWAILLTGIVISLLNALIGYVLAIYFPTFDSYIIPVSLVTTVLGAPFLHYFDIYSHPLFYLSPGFGYIEMMKAIFVLDRVGLSFIAGFVQSSIWIFTLAFLARRALLRFPGGRL